MLLASRWSTYTYTDTRTHFAKGLCMYFIKSNFSSHSQLSEAGITLVSTQYIVIVRHKDRK